MRIGSGYHTYEWIENWGRIPETPSGKANGRTHGVAVTASGQVVVFNQANPGVLIFDAGGKLVSSWGDRFGGAHGLTLVQENGRDYLWLTDQDSREVVKTTLDGKTILNLSCPKIDAYKNGGFVPTWVAVNEERFGGNGDVWVTDGYGKSLVHRYNQKGEYQQTLNGTEGNAGAFACPHGIFFDFRRGYGELYIADRSNRRIQVYDAAGRFKRVFGADFLNSPCCFATCGEFLYVPELFSKLAILDGNDRLVTLLGQDEASYRTKGWPNLAGTPQVRPGYFNSPHGIAVAPNGDIYVVEWIIGGRITKLAKC